MPGTTRVRAHRPLVWLAISLILNTSIPSMLFAQIPAMPVQIGVAGAVSGQVQIASPGAVGIVAQSGKPIYLGDVVTTDAGGRLQIMLLDETIFTIGPNSSLVIDEFVYDPATADGTLSAEVLKGTFRFVTGKIAHKEPKNMKVNLPAGTIGVRGTMVAGRVDGDHSLVVLLGPGPANSVGARIGQIEVGNQVNNVTQTVMVTHPGYGTEIAGQNAPPTPPIAIPTQVMVQLQSDLTAPIRPPSNEPPPGTQPGTSPEGQHQNPNGQQDGANGPPPPGTNPTGTGTGPGSGTGQGATGPGTSGMTGTYGAPGTTGPYASGSAGSGAGSTFSPGFTNPGQFFNQPGGTTAPQFNTYGGGYGGNTYTNSTFSQNYGTFSGINDPQYNNYVNTLNQPPPPTGGSGSGSGGGSGSGCGSSCTQTIQDGITQKTQLSNIQTGTFKYSASGVFTQTKKNNVTMNINGTMTATILINFGSRTIGGGSSNVAINTTAQGGNINVLLNSSNGLVTRSFDDGSGSNASYTWTHTSMPMTASIGLENSGGVVANQADIHADFTAAVNQGQGTITDVQRQTN